MSWFRVKTIARTDLQQLAQARDFWGPMVILGSVFFVFVPLVLLLAITHVGDIHAVQQVSQALDLLPAKAQAAIRGDTDSARTSYALAVYLFAPVAVVVPLTIATAVGATTIVGERERGTGEFLAHSPAALEDIYLGKLIASLLPGYTTTIVGFGLYSLIVNLVVGPKVGGWFFPDDGLVGADDLGGAAVPRVDARDRRALLGAGEVERRRAAGRRTGQPADDHHRVQPVDRGALRRDEHRIPDRCARVDRGDLRSHQRHALDDPARLLGVADEA